MVLDAIPMLLWAAKIPTTDSTISVKSPRDRDNDGQQKMVIGAKTAMPFAIIGRCQLSQSPGTLLKLAMVANPRFVFGISTLSLSVIVPFIFSVPQPDCCFRLSVSVVFISTFLLSLLQSKTLLLTLELQ